MIVWKYVFLYTTVAIVVGFALTMAWHLWRYRVRGRHRAVACSRQMDAAGAKMATAKRLERKSDEWFAVQNAALATVRRDLRSIKA